MDKDRAATLIAGAVAGAAALALFNRVSAKASKKSPPPSSTPRHVSEIKLTVHTTGRVWLDVKGAKTKVG